MKKIKNKTRIMKGNKKKMFETKERGKVCKKYETYNLPSLV